MSEFKQTITIETERKTGETVIRISNPRPTVDEPTVRGTIIGDMTNKSNEPKITDEQRTVLAGLSLLGYRYLACDANGDMFVYNLLPIKKSRSWRFDKLETDRNSYIISINSMSDILDNLCSWEDEKPISIEWLIGKKKIRMSNIKVFFY